MAIQFLNNVSADSGALYVDAIDNRVGINTSSPQVPLEVKYSGTEDEIIRIVGTASGKPQMTFYNGGTLHTKIVAAGNNDFSITNTHSTGDMFFAAGGSTRLHIEANGNVGIGVTDPSEDLEVNGTIYSTPIAYAANQDAYALKVGAYNNAGFDMGLKAKSTSGGSPYLSFSTSSADDVLTMWQSNVGIGTTGPAQKLHVIGNSEITGDIFLGRYIFHNDDTNTWLGFPSADTIVFRTNGSDRMYINSSGNVGIGTNSPTDKLTVENGNIRLNSTSSYPSQGLVAHWNNNSPNMGAINWRNDPGFIGSEWIHNKQSSPYTQARVRMTGDANGNFNVNLNNSQVFTILASNGNVGIGVTNPGAKLDISNTGGNATSLSTAQTYSALTIKPYGSVDSKLTFSADSGNTQIIQATNNASTTGRQIALQPFSGNVGIGTTTPSQKLEVSGAVVASSTMTASNFILSSDEKLKENIKHLNQKPLNVKWKKFELKSEPGVHRVGVIAQELEKTNPEFIREDKDGLKSVAYIDLLITKIAELEARLEKAGL